MTNSIDKPLYFLLIIKVINTICILPNWICNIKITLKTTINVIIKDNKPFELSQNKSKYITNEFNFFNSEIKTVYNYETDAYNIHKFVHNYESNYINNLIVEDYISLINNHIVDSFTSNYILVYNILSFFLNIVNIFIDILLLV